MEIISIVIYYYYAWNDVRAVCLLACDAAGIYLCLCLRVIRWSHQPNCMHNDDDGDAADTMGDVVGDFVCHAYASGSNVLIIIIVWYWFFL